MSLGKPNKGWRLPQAEGPISLARVIMKILGAVVRNRSAPLLECAISGLQDACFRERGTATHLQELQDFLHMGWRIVPSLTLLALKLTGH